MKLSKYHHDILKEVKHADLEADNEVAKWIVGLGLSDKSAAEKYIDNIRPYHFMHCMAVPGPSNPLCRNIFKTSQLYLTGIFVFDDFLEQTSLAEVEQISDSFDMLNEQIRERFPVIPTNAQMIRSLKINEKLIPHVLMHIDWLNTIANDLLQHGDFSIDDVWDFRCQMSAWIRKYFDDVRSQVGQKVKVTTADFMRLRIIDGAPAQFVKINEILVGAVGKCKAHVTITTQLYILSELVCVLINDCYSYHRENIVTIYNTIKVIHENKEVSEVPDAVSKLLQTINATIKYMYQTIEKTKHKYSDNPVLLKVLDAIGGATAGWFFIRDEVSPRYQATPRRFSLVEVEEMELKEWRKAADEKPSDLVRPLLYRFNAKTKELIDALAYVPKTSGRIVPEW